MDITLSTYLISLLASALTEIAKYIPWVKSNQIITSLVAILLVAIGAFLANGMKLTLDSVLAVLIFAFVNYKLVIQPVSVAIGMRTQAK